MKKCYNLRAISMCWLEQVGMLRDTLFDFEIKIHCFGYMLGIEK